MMKYAKMFVAVLATVATALVAAWTGDSVITATEWVNVAILAVGALSVFAAPNVPGAAYTKAILAMLAAGLTVAASAIIGGIDVTEWLQIGLAVLGAIGVYAIPNVAE